MITRKHAILYLLFLLAMLSALLPAAVYGQEGITDDEVNEVAQDIYCPVCESTPLDVCPTAACADWRELIRVKLSEGQSRDEILNYFARQYGDGVLSNPPRRGINLIVLWLLPVLGVLLALLLFSRVLRGLRGATPVTVGGASAPTLTDTPAARPPRSMGDPSPGDPSLDGYIARVEEEIGE